MPTGIGPRIEPTSSPVLRFPRAHGDRPSQHACEIADQKVSPCPRGSAPSPGRSSVAASGFPVPTGIGREVAASRATWTRFPRAHGDRPLDERRWSDQDVVSPCPRGSAPFHDHGGVIPLGFPVPTGIGLLPLNHLAHSPGFPRAHGDRPVTPYHHARCFEVSPCPRGSAFGDGAELDLRVGFPVPTGIGRLTDPGVPLVEGFPVPTGIGRSRCRSVGCVAWFPRAHGDRPRASTLFCAAPKVSPCPRGSALTTVLSRCGYGGFPVPTGIGPVSIFREFRIQRFPRAHGDRPLISGTDADDRRFPRAHGDRPLQRVMALTSRWVSPCPRGSAMMAS